MDKRFLAADGATITDGARMFNYYDCYFVVVNIAGTDADPSSQFHGSWDGWFSTTKEDGSRGPILNGERLAGQKPAWMK